MPGPAQTLCSKCGVRPRRQPGLPCVQCSAETQRKLRTRWKQGQKSKRVTVEPAKPKRFTRALAAERYIVTSAQNATPVHAKFFAALELAAKYLGAELVVIPLRYKNPTSIWTSKQADDEWWANEVQPYLFNTRKKLGANLVLAADVKIQPTAGAPLSGFEALTGSESCILGHPKMQLRTVPAPTGKQPKVLSTTGACTARNYTDSKAGKLGAFHHFLGALVVETRGSKFWLRQVNADREDGSFTDLDLHFTADAVRRAPRAAGLVLGDIHARFSSAKVDLATFGAAGIVETLNPETVVWPDTLDGYAVNPHHKGNPFVAGAKAKAGFGNFCGEVEHAIRYVVDRTRGRRSIIQPSNHDNFFLRWLQTEDWRAMTGEKRNFFLETALAVSRSERMTETGTKFKDPFQYWVDRLKGEADIQAPPEGRSVKILGIECGYHGHAGPKGVPATMKNMARVGSKMITAHAHEPGIEEGHYRVGTSTPLSFEYTRGPSSWLNAHCVIYANGKRSLLFIHDGEWRVPREKA